MSSVVGGCLCQVQGLDQSLLLERQANSKPACQSKKVGHGRGSHCSCKSDIAYSDRVSSADHVNAQPA